MNCSILVRNWLFEAKLLLRSSLRTRMEEQISIWLSHEACLGVKWKMTRWVGSRRNASRVVLDASTPDLPLTPSLRLRPQWRATRRTTDSERWMLRLSHTISHRVSGPALFSMALRKGAKSFSLRVLPITPSTSPGVTLKAAIRAWVPGG